MNRIGEDRARGRMNGCGVAGERERRGGEDARHRHRGPTVEAKAQGYALGDDPNDHEQTHLPGEYLYQHQSEASCQSRG